MEIAAGVLASFLDPIRLLSIGFFGAAAAVAWKQDKLLPLVLCLLFSLSIASFYPRALLNWQLSPGMFDNEYDPHHNPLDVIGDTKYEANYLDRFVAVGNLKATQQVMAAIDRYEEDCRILVGRQPAWELAERCRRFTVTASLVAGALQFAVGAAIGVLWWRRRNPSNSLGTTRA